MVERALFIRNKLGRLVSVRKVIKKVLHWFNVMSFIIMRCCGERMRAGGQVSKYINHRVVEDE